MRLIERFRLFIAYFFRFVGFPVEPKLIKVGNPDQNSPVLITVNFNLTVERLLKNLKEVDCYVLVAPSNGINVWCGACGGDFTTDSVISIVKTSGIKEIVSHRTLILPQLSAPGIDPVRIKKELGWDAKFGPVYAKDINSYIANHFEKTNDQERITFPLKKRVEMANIYFFIVLLLFSIPYWIVAIFLPVLDLILYLETLIISITIVYGSLIVLPSIPSNSGKFKVLIFGTIILALVIFFHVIFYSNLFDLIWDIVIVILVTLIMGEDFHGLTPTYKSDLGEKSWSQGKKDMKVVFGTFKLQPYGEIKINQEECIGCKVCLDVCPREVYGFNELNKKAEIKQANRCINCNACVNRCLAHCLMIE